MIKQLTEGVHMRSMTAVVGLAICVAAAVLSSCSGCDGGGGGSDAGLDGSTDTDTDTDTDSDTDAGPDGGTCVPEMTEIEFSLVPGGGMEKARIKYDFWWSCELHEGVLTVRDAWNQVLCSAALNETQIADLLAAAAAMDPANLAGGYFADGADLTTRTLVLDLPPCTFTTIWNPEEETVPPTPDALLEFVALIESTADEVVASCPDGG